MARTYDIGNLPYTDAPRDLPTAIAVSVLTDAEVVEGNPDGTFRPNRSLNRAEFTTIAMRLLPDYALQSRAACFPDVPVDSWFFESVCLAKQLDIVRGNALLGVPEDEWTFAPERPVSYAEALKVLSGIYELSLAPTAGGEWYVPYFAAAGSLDLTLPENIGAAHQLTRGEMARLVTRFMAYNDDELDVLLAAQQGDIAEEETVEEEQEDVEDSEEDQEEVEVEEELVDVFDESPESDVPIGPVIYDANPPSDVKAGFLMLGTTSSILGGAKVFSEAQPINVNEIVVELKNAVTSIRSMLIYDQDTRLIGRAYRNPTNTTEYLLSLKPEELTLAKGEDFSFYARAEVKSVDEGGISGEVIEIDRMGIEGDGAWNHKTQSAFSTEDYVEYETARSVITSIDNPYGTNDALLAGSSLRVGSFRFKGTAGNQGAELRLLTLQFNVNQTGGVDLSNVELGADGTTERISCTSAPGNVTCSNIPAMLGSFEDAARTLTVYADVAITGGFDNASLQLSLNDPGSTSGGGAVTWTDGTSVFEWVGGDFPVATGTLFRS